MSDEIKWVPFTGNSSEIMKYSRRRFDYIGNTIIAYVAEEPKRKSLVERTRENSERYFKEATFPPDSRWLDHACRQARTIEEYIDERLAEVKK